MSRHEVACESDVLLDITEQCIRAIAQFVPTHFAKVTSISMSASSGPAASTRLLHGSLPTAFRAPCGRINHARASRAASRRSRQRRTWRHCHVPLPPLPEQQRIAAYLDASCAAIDAAVAAKRRQLETLDALRKSIIHQAVTRGLESDR